MGTALADDARKPVYLDGGVPRGIHVFKALAMEASGVAIGRLILYGLSLGGWQGVKSVFDILDMNCCSP